MDISLEGENYTLTSEKEDGDRTWYYKEEKLESSGFFDALKQMCIRDSIGADIEIKTVRGAGYSLEGNKC